MAYLMKMIIPILVLLLSNISLYGQNVRGLNVTKVEDNKHTTGKTYALIVGVSRYKNPEIPQLQFADKDAIAFRNYLVASGIDSNNITLLLNEQATNGAFWANIGLLNDIAKRGDKVFIYFSGHGDVENKTIIKDAYLLPYDGPKYMYAASAIAVILLKNWIATLSANGIQPIFIADACHSGNLAGGREGMEAAASLLKDKWQDEIKILSCQPGELSLESKQWGGGRGLFSYELINGLAGMADKNKDGKITLRELTLYMMDKIPEEASPLPQNPALFGNPETVIACVNVELPYSITQSENKIMARVDTKGFEESLLASQHDSIKYNYKMFKTSLDTGNYLKIDRNIYEETGKIELSPCAYYFYLRVPDNVSTHLLVSLMKRDLCSVIMESADNALNGFFNHRETKSKNMFIRLEYAMRILRDMLGDKKLNALGFLPKLYFFEAYYADISNDISMINRGISVLDSGITIAPSASYLYFERGQLYENIKNENAALADYKKAIQLNPKLLYAFARVREIYIARKMYDSIEQCYKNVLMYDSTYTDAWIGLGLTFSEEKKYDSAKQSFKKALVLDSTSKYAWRYLGILFSEEKKYDEAELSFKKAFAADSNDVSELINLSSIYIEQKKYSQAKHYLNKALVIDSTDNNTWYNLACIYAEENNIADALYCLTESIKNGWTDYAYIQEDTDLDNIRPTPEFKTLMKKYFYKDQKD